MTVFEHDDESEEHLLSEKHQLQENFEVTQDAHVLCAEQS